ncbi:MAG: AAA domain-containing protein [Chitinophagales bacterium]
MAYKSYLVEQFDHTHENKYFRDLDKKLKAQFDTRPDGHFLIGNLSVGGHSLDALFIKIGAIIVIDFKDYGGSVTFSENGPWLLKTEKDKTLFVAGGAHNRNPYQQVNAYRFSLFQLLDEKSAEILSENHINVNWSHTNCLVLFQRTIKFNADSIPAKTQRFFKICDSSNIVQELIDTQSAKLYFDNKELNNILKVLHISEDMLYNAEAEIVEKPEKETEARMDRVIQLIPEIEEKEKEIRAIGMYSTMLSIERINDAKVIDVHTYPIDWSTCNKEEHSTNLEINPNFLNVFLNNRNQRFPKNLFISVNVKLDEQIVPLFYTIIQNSELDNTNDIRINFNSFVIYQPILSALKLAEDYIEDLSTLVNEQVRLDGKFEAAKAFFDLPLEIDNTISFGLSDESFFTAQLLAELRQWIIGRAPLSANKVFKAFLNNENTLERKEIKPQELIRITALNNAQKHSINLAFNQKLTVITGPPGTGKSQVVTNLLANAVYKGEKVLFAGKNNKAVDNVHQRISELIDVPYFIRLGNRDYNTDFANKITSVIENIRNESYEDLSLELLNHKNEIKSILKERISLNKDLAEIKVLQIAKQEKETYLESYTSQYENWIKSLDSERRNLYQEKKYQYNINNSDLNELSNTVSNASKGFFSKFIFNLFKKGKTVENVKSINKKLAQELQTFIDSKTPIISNSEPLLDSLAKHIAFLRQEKETQTNIFNTDTSFTKNIDSNTKELNEITEKLKYLMSKENEFNLRLEEIKDGDEARGIKALKLSINEKLRNADANVLSAYKDYIINGIPWTDEEKAQFSRISKQFTDIFNTVSITSLTIKKAFLQEPEIFDLLVIDEASQSDIASALPLIYRAKKVVVIGDSLQLPHISSVQAHEQKFVLDKLNLPINEYNYLNDSLFEKAKKVSNLAYLKTGFLNEHFRCHPDIIGFSNRYYYLPLAGQSLEIKTKKESYTLGNPGINWVDVKGEIEENRNVNKKEVEQCILLAKKLRAEFPNASIGITTPFKHQKQALLRAMSALPAGHKIMCDTVHKFQGDEKDIIIFSLTVTKDCRDGLLYFLNMGSSYLLNVAVSRAKSALYIVGNKTFCATDVNRNNEKTLLAKLASYENEINSI